MLSGADGGFSAGVGWVEVVGMAYSSIVQMARSSSLISRITAAAAAEGESSPEMWATRHGWEVVSEPGWADAWDYALGTASPDHNPDTGARPGVISDGMILSAVQAIRTSNAMPTFPGDQLTP